MEWAEEDREIARSVIYKTMPLHPNADVTLPSDYGQKNWPIVERRLTQGGLRLARMLNSLLG
jgi:S1/P1 Nuclease